MGRWTGICLFNLNHSFLGGSTGRCHSFTLSQIIEKVVNLFACLTHSVCEEILDTEETNKKMTDWVPVLCSVKTQVHEQSETRAIDITLLVFKTTPLLLQLRRIRARSNVCHLSFALLLVSHTSCIPEKPASYFAYLFLFSCKFVFDIGRFSVGVAPLIACSRVLFNL